MNVTKSDLIDTISEASGITRIETETVVNGFISAIQQAMKDGYDVEIRGLGSFRIIGREPRKARNPKTGEIIFLPKRRTPRIKPSKELRKILQEPDQDNKKVFEIKNSLNHLERT
jgi:nucleoid DNA-binding protein